jgi:primosomal protein N' (replication factor Y) (superfamily II helicase)
VGANKPGGTAAKSSSVTPSGAIARVVLDTRLPHLDRLLDYRIPDGMTIHPGVRVKVPLGRAQKQSTGFVVDITAHSEYTGEIAPIDTVVSPVPVLTEDLWALARAVADRQGGSAADILRLAIPQRAVRVEKTWIERVPHHDEPPAAPDWSHHYSAEAWHQMTTPGSKTALELPPGVINTSTPHPTTKAADTIAALAASVAARGESVVITVPDWRDSDLVERSLLEYLGGDLIVRLGANQTPSEGYLSYLRCLEERPVVVIGQRHAVYQPVWKLGLVVVLSESDDSHREPLAPYPHTRDVALIRAQQSGCALVFADWVTGVDITRLVDMDYLTPVTPTTRERPTVIPTALTLQGQQGPTPGRLPSLAYRAVSDALKDGPVLVQVFRSGFAPGLACTTCRARIRCDGCGGPVTATSPTARRNCSWCGVSSTPRPCSECGGTAVVPIGHGVGRTVTELGKAFPKVPVIQADGDHPTLDVSDKPALVVATRGSEPVAHGGYRAVLLLDGDKMLQRSSLGALEETLRGWEWAASLAAPGASVYVTDVDGPVVHAFAAGAHRDLMVKELRERRELRLPPAIRIASVTGPPSTVQEVTSDIVDAFPGSDILGPVRLDNERVRSVVRFSYAVGADVARDLRAAVIARALSKTPAAKRLRIVLDDLAALDQISSAP